MIRSQNATSSPWHALWAMMVGFFMILVDATIVSVANPSIMASLSASYDAVLWVTSAYLLAYAVPLLVSGRLGDRFGPRNLYLLGLTVFTVASLWCGLADTIGMLVAARVVQGMGAALLTPQTLSTITRVFPAANRGMAMSVWGATAGVATLVGPLAGGILVDSLGWQWIFFVNVPIGVAGVLLAWWLVPELPTGRPRFDVLGVLLSGVGMFLIVFALQEGQAHAWTHWVWGLMALGVGFMAAFLFWQAANPRDPLIPLVIFRDRDFSLSNLGVATIGFVVTGMMVPIMFYAQAVCGLSPTRAALLTAPMAIVTSLLAPYVGRIVDRAHPRPVIGFGFSVLAIAITWLAFEMTPTTPIWRIVVPLTVTGVGMAFIWSPLAATATRNLPPQFAGSGSGVYNTTRQVGAVLGSASMAAFMTWRINDEMPPWARQSAEGAGVTDLPAGLQAPFAAAMSQALLLSGFVALFGVVAALFLLGFARRPLVEPQPLAVEDGGDEGVSPPEGERPGGVAAGGGRSRSRWRWSTAVTRRSPPTRTTTWSTSSSGRNPSPTRCPRSGTRATRAPATGTRRVRPAPVGYPAGTRSAPVSARSRSGTSRG
ncbi:MFS transporter [Mycolicibacterium phlei DSM 43239 = CCUG 21000]|uniref:MFS transporter n=1 Tax=Mycolicibacterium phlei DSM 43239 = CCUG 21000 TaxID=1226750 RepID=A0A5N5URB6_MYCPH|nr:MFS transporter [Mycolicibacterium phlei DSM 43239 = CCUG 21000]